MLIFQGSTFFHTINLLYFKSCDMLKGSYFMESFSDRESHPVNDTRMDAG